MPKAMQYGAVDFYPNQLDTKGVDECLLKIFMITS